MMGIPRPDFSIHFIDQISIDNTPKVEHGLIDADSDSDEIDRTEIEK